MKTLIMFSFAHCSGVAYKVSKADPDLITTSVSTKFQTIEKIAKNVIDHVGAIPHVLFLLIVYLFEMQLLQKNVFKALFISGSEVLSRQRHHPPRYKGKSSSKKKVMFV